jgi:NitT/TauT family transport system substrate-binding protein
MRRRYWAAGLVVLAALGLAAWAGLGSKAQAAAAKPHAALTKITLQSKWVVQAQFAGYYAARDLGYYKDFGLDVNIKVGGPQITPEQVVASGQAQIGIDWLPSLLAFRDKGTDLVNIAQMFGRSGMTEIAFKSTGINSIAKFRGHRVGVWFSGNQYQFLALMAKENMSPPSKYMTVVTQQFVMDPFLNHQLDVAHAMTYNELGVVLEHGVKMSQLDVFDYNKLGVTILEDGIFSTPSWLQSHRAVAVKFLRASIEGWQWAIHHQTAAGTITYSYTPSGTRSQGTLHHQIYMAHEVAKLIEYGPGLSHPIGYMSPAAFHRTWSLMVQDKVLHHAPSSQAYDQSYWQTATAGMPNG